MEIKIMKSNDKKWYSRCIGKRFRIHSESKKYNREKYVVKLEKNDRWLMNGHMYGWVDKDDCLLLKPITYEFIQLDIESYLQEVEMEG